MKELSLYVLDLFQNSLTANSSLIKLFFKQENTLLTIKITDNGNGMDKHMLQVVTDPFATTRVNRNVGLGLAFFSQMVEQSGGELSINSKRKFGTCIKARIDVSHIDTPPMGDLSETIAVMIMGLSNHQDLLFVCSSGEERFEIDTRIIKELLGNDISLGESEVLNWIKTNANRAIKQILNGGYNEKVDRRITNDQAENS